MNDAACLAWTKDAKPTPWQVDKSQVVAGVRGAEMIKMALMVCQACSAQWDCADYAVRGMMRAGTWSMGITNLLWLQNRPDGLDIVAEARRKHAVVHDFVQKRRLKST